MIPLNRPKIFQNSSKNKHNSVDKILNSMFVDRNIEMVFSARQGLDIIYKNLYEKFGSCNVAVSPLTCFDALYPIINNKHKIIFVDINPETFNMDEELIPNGINVIQPIHFGGNPQDMDKIKQKAKENKAFIVEDCAQAFGSKFNNKYVGQFGDFSVFSFVKNLHALGGGVIVSRENLNIPILKESGVNLVSYRILKRFLESKNSYNTSFYEIALLTLLRLKPQDTSFVFTKNRISNKIYQSIENQLNNYEKLIKSRKDITLRIKSKINNKNLIEQKIHKNGESVYTRLLYKLKKGNSIETINKLRKRKIWANHLSQSTISNYQQFVFDTRDFRDFANYNNLRQYNKLHDKIISIPISPILTDKEINYMVFHINNL